MEIIMTIIIAMSVFMFGAMMHYRNKFNTLNTKYDSLGKKLNDYMTKASQLNIALEGQSHQVERLNAIAKKKREEIFFLVNKLVNRVDDYRDGLSELLSREGTVKDIIVNPVTWRVIKSDNLETLSQLIEINGVLPPHLACALESRNIDIIQYRKLYHKLNNSIGFDDTTLKCTSMHFKEDEIDIISDEGDFDSIMTLVESFNEIVKDGLLTSVEKSWS